MVQQRSDSLLLPLISATAIHLLMFGLLFISFHSTKKEQPLEIQVKSAPIIKATAISSETVEKLVQKKQQRINAAAKAEREKKQRIIDAAEKKKQLAIEKLNKKNADEKKRKAEADQERKLEQEKKQQAEADKKRKADAEKKKLAEAEAEKKRLQQEHEKQMQSQMDAEMNAAKEQRVLTELQKYVALIKNKISRNWIIPNQDGKCILEVRLAAGGFIIDVKEVGGSPAICRSAQAAIYKSDPLPVSADPDVFNKMRILRLDLDPQEM